MTTPNPSADVAAIVDDTKAKLADVLKKYAVPDPKIVSKLPKGGIQLDFVGHADITRILIEIDPFWYWEPIKFDDDGLPAYRVENGMAHMAGRMCLLGVERIAIGSAPHNKQDLLKELASDFIRNAAMRFGVSLSLWTKSEWEDLGGAPVPKKVLPARPQAPKQEQNVSSQDNPLTEEQIAGFTQACTKEGLNPMGVYRKAEVKFGFAKQSDLAALRKAFADMKAEKDKAGQE